MNGIDKTVCFFLDLDKTLSRMSDEDAGILMKALFAHANGREPDLRSDLVEIVYPIVEDQMDRLADFRRSKVRSRKEQTTAKESKPPQTAANGSKTEQTPTPYPYPYPYPYPNTNSTKTKFTPPTTTEVAEYANEKGLRIDAQRFVDFYASKGWKVGSSPMKDWKAAVRNWANREKGTFNFDQRGTDYDALLKEAL